MDNLQEIVALWDKYHQTIAVDAMEYDRELRQLLFADSNVRDVSDANIGELISKRQAIDAAIEAVNSWNKSCSIGEQKRIESYIKQLPSAQLEPVRINLNEPIKVKLTDWGKEIYYHQYDSINQIAGREICKPKLPKEDENGYTEFQLWCFIELYGIHMGMTLPNVIEPLEIVYERREDG